MLIAFALFEKNNLICVLSSTKEKWEKTQKKTTKKQA